MSGHNIYGFNGTEAACTCSPRIWRPSADFMAHAARAAERALVEKIEAALRVHELGAEWNLSTDIAGNRLLAMVSVAAVRAALRPEAATTPMMTFAEDNGRRGYDCFTCAGSGTVVRNDMPDGSSRATECPACEGAGRRPEAATTEGAVDRLCPEGHVLDSYSDWCEDCPAAVHPDTEGAECAPSAGCPCPCHRPGGLTVTHVAPCCPGRAARGEGEPT
jgi:hypothetical protein